MWSEVKPILDRALDLPEAERKCFVANQCADNTALRAEVEAYLIAAEDVDDLLEEPILDVIAGRPPEYRTGQRIGDFCLQDEIARGGMGVIYRALRVYPEFDQVVAIKVLKRGFDTGEFVRRFRAEQQILADIDHPYVTRILDGGATEDGLPYLVMELVDGLRVDQFVKQTKLPLEQRLNLFEKICEAVHSAHQHMIVHCDLKPSNILVTKDGRPKILDFGIAKVLSQESDVRTLSLRLGTPGYASPEQAQGGSITTSSDVFSLGALLIAILTERTPSQRTHRLEVISGPIQEFLREKTQDRKNNGAAAYLELKPYSGDLDAIIRKATAWNPADRYDSVAGLAADVSRVTQNLPISAKHYTWLDDLKFLAGRRKIEISVAAFALSALVLSAVFAVDAYVRIGLSDTARVYNSAFNWAAGQLDEVKREAELNVLRSNLVAVMEAKGWILEEDLRKKINECNDLEQLHRWNVEAGIAVSPEELVFE